MHDVHTTLTGFVVPEDYVWKPWEIHTVGPFEFYEEPLRSDLLSKVVRKVEPRAGKIDYNIDGMIADNWFLEWTVGYFGNVPPDEPPVESYWKGHLTLAYSYIDSTQLRISIGIDDDVGATSASEPTESVGTSLIRRRAAPSRE